MKNFTLGLMTLLVTCSAFAQVPKNEPLKKQTASNSSTQVIHGVDKSKSLVVFDGTKKYNLQDAERVWEDVFGRTSENSFTEIRSNRDNLGFTHQRFQQFHNSIKVEFGTASLHSKNDQLEFMTSEYYVIGSDFNTQPAIDAATAFNKAIAHIGAEQYLWEFEDAASEINYEKPEGELVILPVHASEAMGKGQSLALAYKFDIYATYPISRGDLYIDAMTGEALFYNATIKHADNKGHVGSVTETVETEEAYCSRIENMDFMALVTGTAATRYSGTQSIETRFATGQYTLNDDIRDVFTRDALNQAPGTTYPYIANYNEFIDNDNNWTAAEYDNAAKDNAALDAHWGAMMTWDYWDQIHGRDSYDGAGASIRSYVHVDVNYDNAFWNGQVMSYGDGSSNGMEGNGNFDALTSIDVAAHEIGHAVTTFTSNLAYQRESGAMNEGFSDIWGAAVEHFAKGNGSDTNPTNEIWLIGDEIDRRTGSAALRSMSDPTSLGQPDTYGGAFWINPECGTPTNANDYCGVHTNSGVLNYWFYLLVEGGAGTNDIGDAFNVSAIGMTKAADLSYTTLQALSANSTFADARAISIQAAQTAYGACSPEEEAVTNAWYAVGVGTAYVSSCTPQISFTNTTGIQIEDSECSFVDVVVPVEIEIAASQNATVNFTVSGTGSATDGEDFSLETSSVSFPAGSTADQNITIRVYHDNFVEGDETAVIDFTVNANGGDAYANTSADQFTLTIANDDSTHSVTQEVILYTEDVEGPTYQLTSTSLSATPWGVGNTASTAAGGYWSTTGNSTNFAFTNDDQCNCDKSNDLLNTTAIDMSGSYSSALLTFDHAFANVSTETADLLVSTDGGVNFTQVMSITNTSTNNGGGSYTTPWVNGVTFDMSPYIGNADVRVQFRYSDGGGWLYGMAVDNIIVTAVTATNVQTAVNTGAGTEDNLDLSKAGTVYASDATSGSVMATFTNNQADDYGCTTVAVDRAGTGAQSYNGSTSPNLAMDKRYIVTPSNAIGAGNTQLTFFFTEAEIAGWETVTGLSRTTLVIAREVSGAIAETSTATIGAFGSNVSLTGNFTGLGDRFYFGNAATFVPACAGVTKTWDGTVWSPVGAPDLTDIVVINGDYDTTINGALDACTLTINAGQTLSVRADDYVHVNGNITVDGILQVDHLGSVVQTNDNAVVIKNTGATVNVDMTTPALKDRDFILMGNPLDGTNREVTFTSAWKVLDHTAANFIPEPTVSTTHGTTFADENGDNWSDMASGALTPGTGYMIRPVYDHGTTPVTYNYSFSEGTLNNGVITRPMVYNGAGSNPSGTPNVYGNPYASPISTDAFLAANPSVDAVYFWEHITHPSSSISGYHSINFDMDDISIYNGVMGTPAANTPMGDPDANPTNVMGSGQGFGILATSAGTVTFNNSMRLTTGNIEMRNQQSIVENLLLNVRNDEFGVGSYAGVAFTNFTSADLDARYDTERINSSVSLYSHLNDGSEAFAIQSRELFDPAIQIPMGIVSQLEQTVSFSFSITDLIGENLSEVEVWLLDTFTGVSTNLSASDYSFTTTQGQFDNRFIISFTENSLGSEVNNLQTISIYPNPTRDLINIVSPQSTIQSVVIYDMMGRTVQQQMNINESMIEFDLSGLKDALYFVEISTEKGMVTKRIIKQ